MSERCTPESNALSMGLGLARERSVGSDTLSA